MQWRNNREESRWKLGPADERNDGELSSCRDCHDPFGMYTAARLYPCSRIVEQKHKKENTKKQVALACQRLHRDAVRRFRTNFSE
jgi:hypothetical protein